MIGSASSCLSSYAWVRLLHLDPHPPGLASTVTLQQLSTPLSCCSLSLFQHLSATKFFIPSSFDVTSNIQPHSRLSECVGRKQEVNVCSDEEVEGVRRFPSLSVFCKLIWKWRDILKVSIDQMSVVSSDFLWFKNKWKEKSSVFLPKFELYYQMPLR